MMPKKRVFSTFHARNVGVPVFPFEHESSGLIKVKLGIPKLVLLGRAIRVCYTSDKWSKPGETTGYYHDHGPDDGKYALTGKNQTKFYAPRDFFPDMKEARLPFDWPDEFDMLGKCDEWFVQLRDGDKKLIHGEPDDAILLCSPYGWLSRSDEYRVFLAIANAETWSIEGVIYGPDLIVTEDGIEG